MARLEFVFSDKSPIHIIEQELSILSQGMLSILDCYGLNGQVSDTIFSMHQPDLPNALVIVQELESNNMILVGYKLWKKIGCYVGMLQPES